MGEQFTAEELAMPLDELMWRHRLASRRADKLHALSDECSHRRWHSLIDLAIRAHGRAERLSALIARQERGHG
jgi:nitrite reductase/ring-hydroxylating ferredoxin subunit